MIDPYTLNVKDFSYAHAKNPSNVETWEGDLSSFRERGGKVLHYHGTADPIITSENSARYYNFVSRTMGLRVEELDAFYRYFRIPGMGHCSGGVGAWGVGQNSEVLEGGVVQTAQNNVLLRIVEWVEKGEGPETLRGVKYVNVSVAVLFACFCLFFSPRRDEVAEGLARGMNADLPTGYDESGRGF